MANISLGPIVKQIDKSTTLLSKAESKATGAVEKKILNAKIKKLKQARKIVIETCKNGGLTVKVPGI